jgi:hypothetical protein
MDNGADDGGSPRRGSTTSELELTRRRAVREPPLTDRQRSVKHFMVWTLGLAVLVGSSALSFAEPKPMRPPGCQCTCWYTDADGTVKKGVTFFPRPNDTSCTHLFSG